MENKIEMLLNFRIKRGFKCKVIFSLPRFARESIIFEKRNICDDNKRHLMNSKKIVTVPSNCQQRETLQQEKSLD